MTRSAVNIVERLRAALSSTINREDWDGFDPLIAEAADEIERLRASSAREKRMEEALEKIRRTPSMPFPDPGAHSARAWGVAVYTAWKQIQGIAYVALSSDGRGQEPVIPSTHEIEPSSAQGHAGGDQGDGKNKE